ncbi:MAG: hypothetical protein M1325_01200 [Actinobacteria bacterium]|nr:hypothetical protein [Actinomycetota bacterium]
MPTQRLLTQTEYISLTDKYAKAIEYLLAAKGDEDTLATAAYQARLTRDQLVAFSQPDEYKITADLDDAVGAVVTAVSRESDLVSYFANFNSAVLSHLGQDLNTWLTAGGLRVHHYWRRGGNTAIAAANVFPPVTILGSFAVTGAGAGTFTDGQAVDTATYGGAQIELEVTGNPIGAANIDVTVASVLADGSTANKVGTIPSGSPIGTKVALGAASDRVVNITGITIAAGTNGDAFRVQTREDRVI